MINCWCKKLERKN